MCIDRSRSSFLSIRFWISVHIWPEKYRTSSKAKGIKVQKARMIQTGTKMGMRIITNRRRPRVRKTWFVSARWALVRDSYASAMRCAGYSNSIYVYYQEQEIDEITPGRFRGSIVMHDFLLLISVQLV